MYRIQVNGRVSERWVRGFWDDTTTIVQREVEAKTTEMTGEVLDQAALVGLINALYDLGHVLISVERLTVGQINESNPRDGRSTTRRSSGGRRR